LAATYFYVYTVMQLPTGVLVDTLGPRRIVTLGSLVAGVGSVLFGLAETLGAALLGRLLVGLGVSVMFLSLLKLNAVWFRDREFATLGGLTLLIGNLGAVAAAAPLAWMVTLTSWRNVFVALGGLSFVLAGLSWLFVRDEPRAAGLPSMRELEGKAAHPPHQGHWLQGLIEVLKNRATWPGFWIMLGACGTFFSFVGLWAVPYLRDVYGMDRVTAANHTTLFLLGFAFGSLLCGSLSDRLGRRRPVLLTGVALYTLSWLPLLFAWPVSLAASYALFALMGLAASGFTLSWTIAKEANRYALSGMATSVVNTGAFLGAGILQPLVGFVIDRNWGAALFDGGSHTAAANQRLGIAIMLAFSIVALIGAFAVREAPQGKHPDRE
jgi:sugar phosphate permease